MENRFKFRWFDKTIDFMAKVKSLDIEDDYAIVEYSYAESETPDEEVKLSTGVLMQCIGRKDKNGKLIFEGDIIGAIGIVVWEEKDAMFGFKPLSDDYHLTFEELRQDDEDFEIVGNIYENPKLLQEQPK